MELVDETLDEKFMYGKKFTDKENKKLIKTYKKLLRDENFFPPYYSKIEFHFDKNTFNNKKFKKYFDRNYIKCGGGYYIHHDKNKYEEEKYRATYYNLGDISYEDIWTVQECCGNGWYVISIDYENTIDNVLHLRMRSPDTFFDEYI